MMSITSIDTKILIFAAIGMGVLSLILWFFKWLIQRQLNTQFDKINASNMEGRKEREFDLYLSLRGQQVTNDCLHELMYAVMNGTHNGGLQKANTELESYRKIMDETLAQKAAKWSIKIQK